MGDPQVLAGYCLLLPDPVVPDLNALPAADQVAFLADMARVGRAVLGLTGAVRVNYAIFGNLEPALHAHVFPRYSTEPAQFRTAHPWTYDWSQARAFDPGQDGALRDALRQRLASKPETAAQPGASSV
jgi:diadenosine tetraphosphate (Ap4A) HIT family hydrolase